MYRTWAAAGFSIIASALLGGVGHAARSGPPQNTVSRTPFPSAVSFALAWIRDHEPAQSGLPEPAGPQWLPPAPLGGDQTYTRLTRNGYAVALHGAAPAAHSATQPAGGTIAWQVNGGEGAGANLVPYMEFNNPYWRRPAGPAKTIPLGAQVVGYAYRVSTSAAVGDPVQPISIMTWTAGHWDFEVRGGSRLEQVAWARRLVRFTTAHGLPDTPAGVVVVKVRSTARGHTATTQADWMAPPSVGWTLFSDTLATPTNPQDTCHMLTTWRISPSISGG